MGIEAFQAQAGQVLQAAHDGQRFVLRRAVAGHAGIDLYLNIENAPGASGRGRQALRGRPIGQRWRQRLFEDFGVIFGVEAAEEQNRRRKSGGPQAAGLANAGDGGPARARFDGGVGHRRGTHAIGLRLDHGRDAVARLGGRLQGADVVRDGIQVDLNPTQHCYRVYRR